jgi:nucleotide-binding universal stress UspA family protein
MSYASVMVYVEADGAPEQRVRLAADLADRFDAMLIGVSALAVPPPMVADGVVMDEPTEADVELLKAKLADKGEWFRGIAGDDRRRREWRPVLDLPVTAIAREARAADLVVIGRAEAPGGEYRALDPGMAILRLGRPTLVVPEETSLLRSEHVVIGWKDSREARRAMRDALPLLQRAQRVTVVEACGPGEEKASLGRLDDVAQRGSGAEQLIATAREERADLLVTGCYGHSRLGEWMFGGMTRELLATSPVCCLMSH